MPQRRWEGAVSRGMPSGAPWRRAKNRQRITANRVVQGAGVGRGGAFASAVTALCSISSYRDAGYGGRSPKPVVRLRVRPAVDSLALPVRSRSGGVWCEPGSNAIHLLGGLYSLAGCNHLQCGYFTLTVHFHKIVKPKSSCERSLEGRYHPADGRFSNSLTSPTASFVDRIPAADPRADMGGHLQALSDTI